MQAIGVRILLAVSAAFPGGLFLTFLLLPLWDWIEAATGIESVGHSGPAAWCYLASIAAVFALALCLLPGKRFSGRPR